MTVPGIAAHRLTVEHIVIRDVRNLAHVEFEPAPKLNVISGNNGQGKTSILEAIYFLATSRSFRTTRLPELVRHTAGCASVRGRFGERDAGRGDAVEGLPSRPGGTPPARIVREQSAGLEGGRRSLRIDDEPPASLTHYATRSPVVVFEPSQLALSTGPAAGRRRLLDRVTLFAEAQVAAHRSRYSHALRARQRLLATAAAGQEASADEFAAFEALLGAHGAAITQARERVAASLAGGLRAAFDRIASPGLNLEVAYQPGGSADPEEASSELERRRRGDTQRRRTSFGPHLDDLALRIDGYPARAVGSQGQHRAITLALKLAELDCIAQARRLLPVFLLDDVSSELDPERSQALLDYLATAECQIFLTTTRRDLVIAPGVVGTERLDLGVRAGEVEPL